MKTAAFYLKSGQTIEMQLPDTAEVKIERHTATGELVAWSITDSDPTVTLAHIAPGQVAALIVQKGGE